MSDAGRIWGFAGFFAMVMLLLSGCVVDRPMAVASIEYTIWADNSTNIISNLTIDETGNAVLVRNNLATNITLTKADLDELNRLFNEANFSFDSHYDYKCGNSKCIGTADNGRVPNARLDPIGSIEISIDGTSVPVASGKNSAILQKILDKLDGIAGGAPVLLAYAPIQCGFNPWERWYAEGNITFIKAPTDKELLVAYYGGVYGIGFASVTQIQPPEGQVVCLACSCPRGDKYLAQVSRESDAATLEALGWKPR